ncbi:Pleckstrin homology domain-containing proteinyH [Phytophthora infestans]|uniref:Phytanoyl-CoA dioxygenase (PhyH) n=1 Tax=Phytophthora infestans TaxID=4787 RepID=A0A833W6R0_PHYIN|nr:Pleckstrin homology domain-containing proteinyH [Phytophthora infestans]KAF4132897.1 Phytanoyl-CoA dioxygenase (PhyH) [Phytophthora infestans]
MTSKRTRSHSPPAPPPETHISSQCTFATRGWVCVPNPLSLLELRVLQSESSALYARESAESIAALGCVLDGMAQCPIRDSDLARVNSKYYLQARTKQLKSKFIDMEIFASILFTKLPGIAGQLMARYEKSETGYNMFFFNEHYVVKPPRSNVEFRWHRDDDEQLAMCVHRDKIAPYVSAWCALDDVTEVNGALQFVSLKEHGVSVDNLACHASEPVTVKAGDVLFFLSSVWHCSSSNDSDAPRRAFYAQYSRERITARPNDPSPLSFAIPCRGLSTEEPTSCDKTLKKAKI